MTDDLEQDVPHDGPTLDEAKDAAAAPPARVPGSEDLPEDVRDGEAGDTSAELPS